MVLYINDMGTRKAICLFFVIAIFVFSFTYFDVNNRGEKIARYYNEKRSFYKKNDYRLGVACLFFGFAVIFFYDFIQSMGAPISVLSSLPKDDLEV